MDTAFKVPDVRIATDAVNRILRFNLEQRFQRDGLPESGVLFHYTTAEGLKGIVEKNEFWASSAYFLNDSAEVTYGCGVLRQVLDEWIGCRSGGGRNSISLDLAQDLKGEFEDHLLNRVVAPVYLACFCEDGNLLSQWRAYGPTGGYALGFDVLPHTGGFTPEPNTYTAKLLRVEYDRDEQIKRCKSILNTVLPILDEPEVGHVIPQLASHGAVNYQRIRGIIEDMLMEEAVAFKDEAFSVEKEWRLVVRRRELLKQGTDDGGKSPIQIHFRPARGYLIPYLRLIPTIGHDKIPLRSIRSGPTLDRLAVMLSIAPLLNTNGFKGVHLEHSSISARF
jgi:hypothetical protein